VVRREHLSLLPQGAVMVDVAIDQGGCFESSRPTKHSDPVFEDQGIIHYCVTNMPGAVARTSTFALTNATLPYLVQLADKGYKEALLNNPLFKLGLNVANGKVVYRAVARDFGLEYTDPDTVLQG